MVQAAPQQTPVVLSVSEIRPDGGTQPRARLQEEVIDDYAEDMRDGADFPPVVVYHDGENYWLADGFHRVAASKRAGLSTIAVDLRQGSRRDAVLHSVGANARHGLRRSNADKRRAVIVLLGDPEWSQWSNSEIARQCAVDEGLIRRIKKELSAEVTQINDTYATERFGVDEQTLREAQQRLEEQPNERLVQRGGSTYTINTAKIGKSRTDQEKKATASPATEPVPQPTPSTPQTLPPEEASRATTHSHLPRQRLKQFPKKESSIVAIRPKEMPSVREEKERTEEIVSPAPKTAKFVESGTFWELGEQHRLYCGNPASARFRERLPEQVALSLMFPPEEDRWSAAVRSTSTLIWFTKYKDQDWETLREMVERAILLSTNTGDPIVFSYLPDIELLFLAEKLDCIFYCAEPNPVLCEAAISAWTQRGGKAQKVTSLRF